MFNAVLDGTGMLSGESAVGQYPEAVLTMRQICRSRNLPEIRAGLRSRGSLSDSSIRSSKPPSMPRVETEQLDAALIVVTAFGPDRAGPQQSQITASILALSRTAQVARSLSLCWGVRRSCSPKHRGRSACWRPGSIGQNLRNRPRASVRPAQRPGRRARGRLGRVGRVNPLSPNRPSRPDVQQPRRINPAALVMAAPTIFQQFFKTQAGGGALLVACACAALVAANSGWANVYNRLWATPITVGAGGHPVADASSGDQRRVDGDLLPAGRSRDQARSLAGALLAARRHCRLPVRSAGWPSRRQLRSDGGAGLRLADGPFRWRPTSPPSGLWRWSAPSRPASRSFGRAGHRRRYRRRAGDRDLLCGPDRLACSGNGRPVPVVSHRLEHLRVRWLPLYLLPGLGLWFFVHESGIHATIAGVLLAFAIPARTRINASEYSTRTRDLLGQFDRTETGDLLVLTSKGQQEAIFALERASEQATAPLLRLEHGLHGLSAFIIMPLFALSNAGVALHGLFMDRVTVAVVLGLAVGKPLGIMGAALVATRTRLAALPTGVNWMALHGCAWLAGIGFTMSLFIACVRRNPLL